ncbi:MAG: T9SS type A sorting domain-containing protein [Bacteroidota bacterium]|nr:T9SS type A sorting domain-containing protein [Bacteroidota bacterium]
MTHLQFTIADFRFVTLKAYDVLGREVATVVNEEKSPGTYEVTFDASSLPSGIYFYHLDSGGFVETKKMTLLR